MTQTTMTQATPTVASQLLGWDHLEWWVGNARAVTAWLTSGFGFEVTAYRGPETGARDRVSYVLAQGAVRFVVTAGLGPDSEVARHVLAAWRRDSPPGLEGGGCRGYGGAGCRQGGTVVAEPTRVSDDDGTVTTAAISTYGETRHLFVERSGDGGGWGPGFGSDRLPPAPAGDRVGLTAIDHVVGNVEQGRLDEWVDWYIRGPRVRGVASFRRRPDLYRSTRPCARRWCTTAPASSCPSTSRRRA